MDSFLNFKVHPRLADLLGEEYRSSERALKELVDNAWDADADNLHIMLPQKLGEDTITVEDDGIGMTENDLSVEYLNIARDRRLNGEKTKKHNRKIRGRRGVGKFAGLTIANNMALDTKKEGYRTTLSIDKSEVIHQNRDIEEVQLPITKVACQHSEKGTCITLTKLNQLLALPDPEKLKELLVLDYGRERGFNIFINSEILTLQSYPGQDKKFEYEIPGIGHIELRLKILDSPNKKNAGAFFRLNNKLIDEKDFLGIDEVDELPEDICHRFIAEIGVDTEDETLSGNSDLPNTSSKAFRQIKKVVLGNIIDELKKVISSETDTRLSVFISSADSRIATLPDKRKMFFDTILKKLLLRFHTMTLKNLKFLVSLILDALEYTNKKD